MKTARRQELRTNELSQQIDRLGETIRQHGALMVAAVVGGILIVFAGYWYFNHRSTLEEEGWSKLTAAATDEDIDTVLRRHRAVAEEQISPALTRAAWLSIGNRALAELNGPRPTRPGETDASEPDPQKLTDTAREAFAKVIELAGDDRTALGGALIGLGVVEENRGDFEQARAWYERVVKDPRFAETPFRLEAEYRLGGLAMWSKPVVLPPPPAMELVSGEPKTLEVTRLEGNPFQNPPAAASTDPPPAAPTVAAPASPTAAPPASPTAAPPAIGPSPPPTPTTQPAEADDATPPAPATGVDTGAPAAPADPAQPAASPERATGQSPGRSPGSPAPGGTEP